MEKRATFRLFNLSGWKIYSAHVAKKSLFFLSLLHYPFDQLSSLPIILTIMVSLHKMSVKWLLFNFFSFQKVSVSTLNLERKSYLFICIYMHVYIYILNIGMSKFFKANLKHWNHKYSKLIKLLTKTMVIIAIRMILLVIVI